MRELTNEGLKNRNEQLVKTDVVLKKKEIKTLITDLTHFYPELRKAKNAIAIQHNKTFQFVLSSFIISMEKKIQ